MTAWLSLLIASASVAVIAGHAAAACWAVLRGRGPDSARHILAEGVILALSLGVAGAVLRTMGDPGWDGILRIAALLALRILIKRAFQAELARTTAVPP